MKYFGIDEKLGKQKGCRRCGHVFGPLLRQWEHRVYAQCSRSRESRAAVTPWIRVLKSNFGTLGWKDVVILMVDTKKRYATVSTLEKARSADT